jgi:hypothetical protein
MCCRIWKGLRGGSAISEAMRRSVNCDSAGSDIGRIFGKRRWILSGERLADFLNDGVYSIHRSASGATFSAVEGVRSWLKCAGLAASAGGFPKNRAVSGVAE